MPLYRLAYRSVASIQIPQEDWDSVVEQVVAFSARLNASVGISGALIASNGMFVQVLEGPLGALEATFERICRDLRHERVILMEFAAQEDRLFEDWSMVRIDNVGEVVDVCSLLGIDETSRLHACTASALLSLMRNLLLSRRGPPSGERPGPTVTSP